MCITNEEVHAKIQPAIGPHEDLMTIIKRRKQQWYGHVSRSSGLAKTILQGTVKGGRRQDRQRKRWEDNIREWTGLEFGRSQRAVEDRENGENWLRNHLWCPNDLRGQGIDDDDDDEIIAVICPPFLLYFWVVLTVWNVIQPQEVQFFCSR